MTTIGRTGRWCLAATLALAPSLLGCRGAADARAAAGEEHGGRARRVQTVVGFHGPESVRYDPEQDVFYVSNMYLYGSWKDNNGFITRIEAGDVRKGSILAQGGVNGVTLHAPKGMALQGDTLWVADIDVVRGFHRTTGAPLATIDFAAHRPTLLNDVALGPDATLRVTDTGIVMSQVGTIADTTGDRVFIVGPGRAITALAAGAPYPKPNGITWDPRGQRWLVVTFDRFDSKLYAIGKDTTRTLLVSGKGQWDGVEVLDDGRILLSSWSDSSIHLVEGTRDRQVVRHVPHPADIGIDTKRNRIAIPLAVANRVELWTVPR
jgi:sugar lactone lactonase YvrE